MLLEAKLAATFAVVIGMATPALSVTIDVDIQVIGLSADAPVDRCICFDAYTDCSTCPTRVCEVFTFGPPANFPGRAQGQIILDGAPPAIIEAVDPLHTLRSFAAVEFDGSTYSALFDGDPAFGGTALTSGNLNGDTTIDILDTGVWAVEQGNDYGTGSTTCDQGFRHADLNGDGVVDSLDSDIITTFTGRASVSVCPDPPPAGPDGDAVNAACDNCPDVFNPDQQDADTDTVGDACDNCPGISNSGQEDVDGDSVGNVCDNCLNDANADQNDTDTDQVGDVCDNCPNDFNPNQEDSDGNGIGDVCEPTVPAVSEWGMVAMMLLVLTAGTMALGRRKIVATTC